MHEVQQQVIHPSIETVLCQYKDATHETINLIIEDYGKLPQPASTPLVLPAANIEKHENIPPRPEKMEITRAEKENSRPTVTAPAQNKTPTKNREVSLLEMTKLKDALKPAPAHQQQQQTETKSVAPPTENNRIIRRVTGNLEVEGKSVSKPKPRVLRKSFI